MRGRGNMGERGTYDVDAVVAGVGVDLADGCHGCGCV